MYSKIVEAQARSSDCGDCLLLPVSKFRYPWDGSPGGEATGQDYGHMVVSVLIWVVAPIALGLTRILRSEVK